MKSEAEYSASSCLMSNESTDLLLVYMSAFDVLDIKIV